MSRRAGDSTSFICTVDELREHTAKNGDRMAFCKVSDRISQMDVVIFPDLFRSCRPALTLGAELYIGGKVSLRDGRMNVIAERIVPVQGFIRSFDSGTLYIHADSRDKQRVDRITALFGGTSEGSTKVSFVFDDIRRTLPHRIIKTCRLSPDLLRSLTGLTRVELSER